ncbi:hypothetical protein [Methylohalobius crimeensis]|uniref:hypothetical protein n=1 Tax=Methylohalobius crimeensis TaxID=244365 RepID=UPI0003B61672|nr:hypothetical protein [Methylohalobius crimeensis]
MNYLLSIIALLLIPGLIARIGRRLFPRARRPELLLLFGLAATGFGIALWRAAGDPFALIVGWYLIAALSWAGYRAARFIIR